MESFRIDLYSAYLVFGAFFGIFWGLGILLTSSPWGERIRVFSLLFCSSIWLIGGAAFFSGFLFEFPILYGIHLPFTFAIAPILFLHFQNTILKEKSGKIELILHFLPVVLSFVLFLPFWTGGQEFQLRIFQGLGKGWAEPYSMILALAQIGPKIWILIYLLPLLFIYKNYLVEKEKNQPEENARRIFLLFLALVSAVILLGFLGVILKRPYWIRTSAAGLPLLILFAFLVSQKNPFWLGLVGNGIREIRYKKSRLKGKDENDLRERLETLMREEKLYADEDLTLGRLAEELDLSQHQLSEFLNDRMSMKFSDYVNSWRIKEAKGLLLENTERSVLAIAESVGFNSKSSFNEAFRKFTARTPSEFRKNIKKF